MKLAEALNERKALKDTLTRLMERLEANARVQEGDAPSEAPADLLVAVGETLVALEDLIVRINRTNMAATLGDGRSLMQAIARRDVLHLRRTALDRLVKAAGTPRDRWALTRDEIRRVVTVDVAALERRPPPRRGASGRGQAGAQEAWCRGRGGAPGPRWDDERGV